MSKLSVLVSLNAYSDVHPSNAPSLNNFKYTRDINCIFVNNPDSLAFTLAPGETRPIFNGTRALAQDGTTQYNLTLKAGTTNTYVLSWAAGTKPNFRIPRVPGADATTAINISLNGPLATLSSAPSIAASFTGQVAGMTSDVTLMAITAGSTGNSISLSFDGALTIADVISNWNTANPSNTLTLTAGIGTQVPDNATTIALAGGITRTPLNLISGGVVAGDKVRLGSVFNLSNQGEQTILSVSATSFTVANETIVPEGPIVLGSGFADQLQIYSAAGVQVNDTLDITGGFSPVTLDFYKVTSVSANSLEFFSSEVLPVEGPILTQGIVLYSMAKTLIYLESDQECSASLNGSNISMIKPFVINSSVKRGFLMNSSVIYSLTITNLSSDTAKLFLASVE